MTVQTEASSVSEHDLWIGDRVLTVSLDKGSTAFPPNIEQTEGLNETIRLLARAAKAVAFQARNDETADGEFLTQPIEGIADAIILLSQLAEAVHSTTRVTAQ